MIGKSLTIALAAPAALVASQTLNAASIQVTATGNVSNLFVNTNELDTNGLNVGETVTFNIVYDLEQATSIEQTRPDRPFFAAEGAITSYTATYGGITYELVDPDTADSDVSLNRIRSADNSATGDLWNAVYNVPLVEGSGNPTAFSLELRFASDAFDGENLSAENLNGLTPISAIAGISAAPFFDGFGDLALINISDLSFELLADQPVAVPTPSAAAMGFIALPLLLRRRQKH